MQMSHVFWLNWTKLYVILDLLWSLRGLEPKRIQLKPIYFNINIKGYVITPLKKALLKY